jgi:hypothetical protein
MLRDPVEAIRSLHTFLLYSGDEDIADVGEALAAEPERMAGRRIPPANEAPWALFYRDLFRYRAQLERYLEAFGTDRVHVIVFDDFRGHTDEAYRATLQFLGVDPDFVPELGVRNANKRARSRALGALMSSPDLKPRLRRVTRAAIPSHAARLWLYRRIVRANTVREPPPPLPPVLKRRLEAEFADEVSALAALLGRDLSHWLDGIKQADATAHA